jgi:hypothetical protein
VDGLLEDLIYASHLLATAFHVERAHLFGDLLALLLRDGSEALGLEEVDAGSLCAEVRFEAYEDERRVGAEVEDFRVPLLILSV